MTIFTATDYREFLKSRVELLKSKNRKFSYQQVATSLGTTKSYLKLVIDKKRHMSLDKVIPLSALLKLTPFETQFLIFLFLNNTSKNAMTKEFFSSIIASYAVVARSNDDKAKTEIEDVPDFASANCNWVEMAALCLVSRKDFEADAGWIQEKLGGSEIVSLDDVQSALRALLDRGYIVKTKAGYQHKHESYISDPTPVDVEYFKSLMTAGLKRTALAVNMKGKSSIHRPNRHHTYCVNLNNDEIDQVMKLSSEYIDKFLAVVKASKNGGRAMFVSSHAFAVSVDDQT